MWSEKVKTGYKFVERYRDPLTGKIRRASVVMEKDTAQTRKVAQRALDAKIQAAVTASDQPEEVTVSRLIEKYREEQAATLKASTCRRNYWMGNLMMDILGKDTLVDALTANYIRSKLIALDRTPEQKNEILKRFKGILKWGYKHDYIKDISYLEKIEFFKAAPHKEKIQDKFLEAKEAADLIAGMQQPIWKAVTQFLILSGLRIGELAALDKKDVLFKDCIIRVTKTYDAVNRVVTDVKTIESRRDVYIQDDLFTVAKEINLLMLKQKMMYGYQTDLFIADKDGGHIKYYAYNKYLKEKSKKILGRGITPHTLRHTHASLLMEQGISIDTISRRLGHADSQITREIYLHVTKKLTEKETEQLKGLKII